ncbi:MAG: sulfurtransferase-like selenium metabolism protein YedF [Bacteroidales bacterium]|jgi:selenium metabolism protein YedF|nr:sulfurtransferase-like selenium metabolism protein YedF [Bacteroidales bacterium]
MKTVDARGMPCPLPIIETKKALRESDAEEILRVLIDNETSLGNVCRFLEDNGCTYRKRKESGYWSLEVARGAVALSERPEDEYCNIPAAENARSGYVVALTSEAMGTGDETLGKRLMTSFVNILTELDTLPSAVVCYNSGVKLALPGSPVVETLTELEKRGVDVILCGTCADYFEIKGKTIVGRIGDMYLIAGKMAEAPMVLRP